MHPPGDHEKPAMAAGPHKTALDSVTNATALLSVCLAGLLIVGLVLAAVVCWIKWRRKTRKRVDGGRPITLRRPTAVRNPTSHSHYLKKSPSPTGCKSPPGTTDKPLSLTGSPSSSGDSSKGLAGPGVQRGGATSVGGTQRAVTPKLLSPTDEKRTFSEPNGTLSPLKSPQNQPNGDLHFERETGGMTLSQSKEEIELNCKNITRDDSIEKLGKLYFKLRYKNDNGALIVTIIKCTDLPHADGSQSSSDPYVKLQLLPDKHHKAKTRVLRNTHQPVYEEDFTFYGISLDHLKELTLHFVVLSFDRYSRDDIIGEVVTPLAPIDLKEPLTLSRPINPRSLKIRSQGRGELLLSLCHQPAATRLTVVVLKARNLPKMDITGLSDPYVKIYLLYNGQRLAKKKTHVKKRTVNPVFNESFVFDLPSGAEDLNNVSLEFMLLDWDRVTKNEVIGRLEMGGARAVGSAKHHWAEVISSPRRQIAEWHKLREASK